MLRRLALGIMTALLVALAMPSISHARAVCLPLAGLIKDPLIIRLNLQAGVDLMEAEAAVLKLGLEAASQRLRGERIDGRLAAAIARAGAELTRKSLHGWVALRDRLKNSKEISLLNTRLRKLDYRKVRTWLSNAGTITPENEAIWKSVVAKARSGGAIALVSQFIKYTERQLALLEAMAVPQAHGGKDHKLAFAVDAGFAGFDTFGHLARAMLSQVKGAAGCS